MPRESGIEKAVCESLRASCEVTDCIKLGKDGWPDRMVLLRNGMCFFIEMKQPGEKLRPDQRVVIDKLRRGGFLVLVVDSRDDGRRLASWVTEAGLGGAQHFGATHALTP